MPSSAASSGCEDSPFSSRSNARDHACGSCDSRPCSARIRADGGNDQGIVAPGGPCGGELLLGLRVAAHPHQDSGADEPEIGVVGRRLAFDQRMRLAADHLEKDELEREGNERRSARGQRW